MNKNPRRLIDVFKNGPDDKHLWDPDFSEISGEKWAPKGDRNLVMACLSSFGIQSPAKLVFRLPEVPPKDGFLVLSERCSDVEININELNGIIDAIARIYAISVQFCNSSPTLNNVLNEIHTINYHAERLYVSLVKSNHFTRQYMHYSGPLGREYDETYLEACGPHLPRSKRESEIDNPLWLKRLNSLMDLLGVVELELEKFTNPVKGPLFKKEYGSPEFMLVFNSCVILITLGLMPTINVNGQAALLAQCIREYAVGHPEPNGWQYEHLRSIIKWLKEIEECDKSINAWSKLFDMATEECGTDPKMISHLQMTLCRLERRFAWLKTYPGRYISESDTSRGNIPLFPDSMLPVD